MVTHNKGKNGGGSQEIRKEGVAAAGRQRGKGA